MTSARAAVLERSGAAFTLGTIELDAPRDDELLVALAGVGICHTDLACAAGTIPVPTPIVLGHEGAGRVVAAGSAVTGFAPGDTVVLSYASCGECSACADAARHLCAHWGVENFGSPAADGSTRATYQGRPVGTGFFGQSSFASHVLVRARNAIRLPDDVPVELMGPLGCGIMTGAGAVLRAAPLRPGARLVIFGAGSVGLAGLLAARLVPDVRVLLVDRDPARLERARGLGADVVLNAAEADDLVAGIVAGLDGPADRAVETTGVVALAEVALRALAKGGHVALVGAYAPTQTLDIAPRDLMANAWTIGGVIEGNCDPHRFIPELVSHYRAGRFPFDRLISFYPFDRISDAIDDMKRGTAIKPVLRFA